MHTLEIVELETKLARLRQRRDKLSAEIGRLGRDLVSRKSEHTRIQRQGREDHVRSLKERGLSDKEIGKLLGVSAVRALQIRKAAETRVQREEARALHAAKVAAATERAAEWLFACDQVRKDDRDLNSECIAEKAARQNPAAFQGYLLNRFESIDQKLLTRRLQEMNVSQLTRDIDAASETIASRALGYSCRKPNSQSPKPPRLSRRP